MRRGEAEQDMARALVAETGVNGSSRNRFEEEE